MSTPKKKLLKKKVRKLEDELGVDSTVEDVVDGLIDLFDDDDDSDDDSGFSNGGDDDSDDDDFGGGDFGGGGSSDDW
jgi:uncharacterized membrane protein YgcG